jgi:hypothetical protein
MATPLPTPAPLPTVTPAPPAKPIKITDVDTRVMDTEMSWNYAWKVMIRNDGDQELTVAATVYFLDADGFQIDTSYIDGDIAPHSEREFIGDERIDAELGPKVAEVIAHIDYAFIPGTLDHVQRGD